MIECYLGDRILAMWQNSSPVIEYQQAVQVGCVEWGHYGNSNVPCILKDHERHEKFCCEDVISLWGDKSYLAWFKYHITYTSIIIAYGFWLIRTNFKFLCNVLSQV